MCLCASASDSGIDSACQPLPPLPPCSVTLYMLPPTCSLRSMRVRVRVRARVRVRVWMPVPVPELEHVLVPVLVPMSVPMTMTAPMPTCIYALPLL
jgi:hypothetical protein